MALRIGGVGEDVGERDPRRAEADERPGRAAGHVAPDRLAGGGERGVRQRHAQRLGHDLRRGGGAQELAAAARAGAGPAAELGGLLQASARRGRSGRRSTGSCRRPRPRAGGSVTPPGTSTHGRCFEPGQGHHHGRQSLVAGGDAEHALAAGQRADQAAEDDGRVVAIRAGCPSSRPSPGSGRRRGRRPCRRTGRRPAASAPRPPPGPAGRSPSGRCDSPARSACRRARAGRPACSGSGTGRGRPRSAFQPMPAFWLRPNRSPEGQCLSISSVSGSAPCVDLIIDGQTVAQIAVANLLPRR